MKATEQFFPVVLFVMLYNTVLNIEAVYLILKSVFNPHVNESY